MLAVGGQNFLDGGESGGVIHSLDNLVSDSVPLDHWRDSVNIPSELIVRNGPWIT